MISRPFFYKVQARNDLHRRSWWFALGIFGKCEIDITQYVLIRKCVIRYMTERGQMADPTFLILLNNYVCKKTRKLYLLVVPESVKSQFRSSLFKLQTTTHSGYIEILLVMAARWRFTIMTPSITDRSEMPLLHSVQSSLKVIGRHLDKKRKHSSSFVKKIHGNSHICDNHEA